MKMLTENDVIENLVNHLRRNGYTNINSANTSMRGIDINAINVEGRGVCIEAKGETSSKQNTARFGLPFQGKQIASHVAGAILQTMVTMNQPKYEGYEFGIAFPMNHEELVRKIMTSLTALKIKVYLVSWDSVIVL